MNKIKKKKYVNFNRSWKRVLAKRHESIALLREPRLQANEEEEIDFDDHNEIEPNVLVPLEDQLKSWAFDNRISMNGLDGLLAILRSAGHTQLPKSYRTMLQTPRNIELETFGNGKYWYRGLTECLKIAFLKLDRNLEIKLTFNIDGLPIFNSSQTQFWPILASIDGMYIRRCQYF